MGFLGGRGVFGTYFSSCWSALEEGFCISAARVSFRNFSASGGSSFRAARAWRLWRAIMGGRRGGGSWYREDWRRDWRRD